MVMEAWNLAVAWSLPAIFICKDNGWSITTRSSSMTGGDLTKRAEAFGLAVHEADGLDAMAVWKASGRAFEAARRGKGPQFLRFVCSRLDGHFLGDPLIRVARHPVTEGAETIRKSVSASLSRQGGVIGERAAGLIHMMKTLKEARKDRFGSKDDPVARARAELKKREDEVIRLEEEIDRLTSEAVEQALASGETL
jgi:pyruvate dehydrogenase E1 component alpha subunit